MKGGSKKKGKGKTHTRMEKVAGAGKRINCQCRYCDKEFTDITRTNRHEKGCSQGPDIEGRESEMFQCQYCHRLFLRKGDVNQHERVCPQGPVMEGRESEMFQCQYCLQYCLRLFLRKGDVNQHERVCPQGPVMEGRESEMFPCQYCRRLFPQKDHMKIKKEQSPRNTFDFYCESIQVCRS